MGNMKTQTIDFFFLKIVIITSCPLVIIWVLELNESIRVKSIEWLKVQDGEN